MWFRKAKKSARDGRFKLHGRIHACLKKSYPWWNGGSFAVADMVCTSPNMYYSALSFGCLENKHE
jgi:hypothetical protein